jgi:hypothetical protein
MGNRISYENQAIARAMSAKFTIGTELSVDEFDMFIIDQKMVKDPGTDDPKDSLYKGFIQGRNNAKNAINRAAGSLDNGERFIIEIIEPGKTYKMAAWGEASLNIAKDVGNRVRTFSKNRQGELKRLYNNVEMLYSETGGDDQVVEDLHEMLSTIRKEGLVLEVRIQSMVAQFNGAVNAVEAQIRIATEERKVLEDHSEE